MLEKTVNQQSEQLLWYKHSIDELQKELGGLRAAIDWDRQARIYKDKEVQEKYDLIYNRANQQAGLLHNIQENIRTGQQKQHRLHIEFVNRFEAQTRRILENQTGHSHRGGKKNSICFRPY